MSGFLVLDESEPVPGCVQRDSVATPHESTYELALPPGPYRQEPFESQEPGEEERVGWSYFLRDTDGSESPAFVVHRTRTFTLAPPIVRGDDPKPWDPLPGPAVLVQRPESQVLAWIEDKGAYSVSYELEIFSALGFSLEQAANMLVYFDPMRSEATRWDSETGTFVTSPWAPWLYPDSATTGVLSVDAVLAAVRSGESLAPLIDTVPAPCVQNPPPGPIFPPACGEGQPEGALVPAFVTGACPSDDWGATDASNVFIPDSISPGELWLFAVAEAPATLPSGVDYFVIFTSGERITTLALTEDGVAGIGGGGSCAANGDDFSAYLEIANDWLLPPIYPIPPG